MTPEDDEQMTMRTAMERIADALGYAENLNASRNISLWPDSRRYSAHTIIHYGCKQDGTYPHGVVIKAEGPTLEAALVDVVQQVERYARNLRSLAGNTPIKDASTHDHQRAAQMTGVVS